MNKKFLILAIIVVLIAIGLGIFIYYNKNNSESQNSYQANKISASENSAENVDNAESTKNSKNENTTENAKNSNKDGNLKNAETKSEQESESKKPIEEQLSTFSTNIMSSDPSRQHNIELTCNRLNGTIVKNGDTFSFYNILGPSTKEKGYLEADILDQNRK